MEKRRRGRESGVGKKIYGENNTEKNKHGKEKKKNRIEKKKRERA